MRQHFRTGARVLFPLVIALAVFAANPASAFGQVDLVLNLSDAPDPIPAGGVITYSVSVSNDALLEATGVEFSLAVPDSLYYQGFSGTGVTCSGMTLGEEGPSTLQCALPDLFFEESVAFSVDLQTEGQGLPTISAAVTSTEPEAPGQSGNNSVVEQTTVVAGADVVLTLTAPPTAPAGSSAAFSIRLDNDGPDVASALAVQFPVPTGFTLSGGLPAGCTVSAGTVNCTVAGSIASGGNTTIGPFNGQITSASGSTVTGVASVQVSAGAPVGTAQDPNSANNTSVANITVTAGSDVRLTKTRSVGGPYFVGDGFDFILTASYTGDSPSNLTITDVIPPNYTVGTLATPQSGWDCSLAGQTVTCTRASGGPSGGTQSLGSISIPVTINAAGSAVTNTAIIAATTPFDPNPGNNTTTDGGINLQDPTADLTLSKQGPNPALAVVGFPFNYTLTVSNGGPSEFYGTLTVTDQIPVGLEVTSVTADDWSCLPAAPLTGDATLICTLEYTAGSPLASGSNAPGIVLNTTATIPGLLTNEADLTTSNPNVPDPNLGNNSDDSSVTADFPADAADIRVIKSASPASVPAGEVLTYTLEIVNDGPVAAGSVTLTDNLGTLINNSVGPTGAGYIDETIATLGNVAPGDLTCTHDLVGGVRQLSCQVATLPVCTAGPAGSCPIIEVAIRPGGNGGSRSNTVSVISSVTADSSLANNTATISSNVEARADITVTKTASPSPATAGQQLVYVVTARNNGPSRADGVTVADTLPLNVVFVSASPTGGSCSTPGANVVTTALNRIVTCTLDPINNGAQRTVTIRVKPSNATRGSPITNNVTVATTTIEPPVPGDTNNSASVEVFVADPSLDLLVNKTDDVDPVAIMDTTTYTVRVTNVGPSDAENVLITDDLPGGGLSFQRVTPGSAVCSAVPAVNDIGGQILCTIARLAAGASATLTIDMVGVSKGIFTNNVSVESDETGLNFEDPSNNTAAEATTVRTRSDMELVDKVASPASVAVRRPFTWILQVRNNVGAPLSGLAEADDVEVTDVLPAGVELTGTPVVSIVSGTASLTTCTGAAGETSFTCDLGTVSSGAVVEIAAPVRALSVPAGGTFTNSATVSTFSLDVDPDNNTNSGDVTVEGSSLAGTVFRDFADDGAVDPTDTGISGITITLTGTAFDDSPVSLTTTTLADGTFSFAGLPEGSYTITRGTVSEAFLVVGEQVAGDPGADVGVTGQISGIGLGEIEAGTGYLFAFVPQARIGLAKRTLSEPTLNPDSSFTVEFRMVVENFSLESVDGVSITDPMEGDAPRFGTHVSGGAAALLGLGSYTIETAPTFVGTCVGGTANGGFDGDGDPEVATIASLASGSSCEFGFTLRFVPLVPLPPAGYQNQATVSGTGALSGQALTDQSQVGIDPDPGPGADNDPTNNDDPTPVAPVLIADVTTSLSFPAEVDAGELVSGIVVFENAGPFQAEGVGYTLTLSPGLTGVTFTNLPSGATATYDPASGTVTFAGMPSTLQAGQIASGDGVTGIGVNFVQNSTATTSVSSAISTATSQGANVLPDSSSVFTVGGGLIADVTTALDFPSFAGPNATVEGTVTYRNNGPSVASDMTYSLTLTPGLAGVSFGNLPVGATATYDPGTGVVTFVGMPSSVAPGEIVSGDGVNPIDVIYTQPTSAISHVASGIGTSTNQGVNSAPDTANLSIIGDATVGIAKAGTVSGDTITYDIKIRNTGTAPANSISIIDDLSKVFGAGNFFVVSRPTFVAPPTAGSITLNPRFTGNPNNHDLVDQTNPEANLLPVGASAVIRVRVLVKNVTDQGFGVGVYENRARITSYGPGGSGPYTDESVDGTRVDPNENGDPTDDDGPTVTTIPVDATVGIAKGASVSGRRVTFDLVLINTGNALASEVSVFDDLDVVFGSGNYIVVTSPFFLEDPGTLTLNAGFTGGGSGAEILDPTVPGANTLAPGDTAIVRFAVDLVTLVDMGSGLGVYENQAVTTSMGPGGAGPFTDRSNDGVDPDPDGDGDPGNNSIPTPITFPLADLSLEKTGPAAAMVGDTIQYTLTVTNEGPGVATGILVQDRLPEGVGFVSASQGGTETAGVVSWPEIANLAPGALVVRTVDVEILQAGSWENVGTVESALDPNPGNNDGSDPKNRTTVTTADASADLVVKKSGPLTADVGQTVTYIVTTTNQGPDAARAVTVSDFLPKGAEFVSASRGAVVSGRTVTWPAIPSLDVNQVVVDTVRVVLPAPGVYRDVASAGSVTQDPDSSNNDGSSDDQTVTTTVGSIDLSMQKILTSELKAGETATWDLEVSNNGTLATFSTITVVDTLPAGLSFVSAAGPGWICSAQGQVVTCTLDDSLEPGSASTLTLTTQVDAAAGETIVNGATVITEGEEPGDDNTGETDPEDVQGEGDLLLVKTVAETGVEVGDLVRYELVLTNTGLGAVRGVTVQDRLPRGFFLVGGSVVLEGQTAPDPDGAPGPLLDFHVGDVGIGEVIRISYTVRVGVGAGMGEMVNTARASDAAGTTTSNEASASVQIRPGVFSELGHIMGRVWVEVSDSMEFDSREQEERYEPTLGVAGVRVYLQDGTSAVTDVLGRYSFTDLRPRQWVVRVDERTLPAGMVLSPLTARHMGGGVSKFVDLTRGELARADFGDAEADTLLYRRVEDRAALGPLPEIAVPSRLVAGSGGSMARGPGAWRDQTGLSGQVSNLGVRPGVGPWSYGPGQAGGTSLGAREGFSPLFRRPGSTSGMALDPAADRHGGSGYATGIKPEETAGAEGLRMLISGFIEGRFDLRSLTDGELFQNGERDRFQDALLEFSSSSEDGRRVVGGRAAAFATGELGNGYQLTLRFDTEKDPTRRFFNDIRPDEMYDVFGDASATLFEAQSKGRVFGALGRGNAYLMYGDFNTATYDAAQLLGRYSRTLNGVFHQYESERGAVRAFASRDRFRQIVDEIPAMGISGPYALSQPDGLLNSERVEIITRDRNQPSLILDIVPLERFTDYTIEPFTGRLIFKRPIPSLDEGLNPVSIRVTYESETGGDSFWVFGADARADAGDRLTLGAGFVRDDSPGNRYDLFSANAGLALGEGTWINGEFARSDSAGVQSGNAMRLELRHASESLDLRGYYLTADSVFLNPSAGVGAGRTEMGVNGTARVRERTSVLAEIIRSQDDRTDHTLTGGRLALLRRLGERISGQVGYRYGTQDGTLAGQSAPMDDVSALGARLEVEPIENGTVFGEFEQNISDSDARRLAVGGDFRLLDRMRLYARHEFLSTLMGPYSITQGQDRNSTVFGVSADYREGQSVFSEYRVGNGISGRGAHAAIGLRNQWEIDEGVRLHTTFERVSPMDSLGSGDVLAVTGALELATSPFWKGTLRGEYRATERQDQLLGSVGFARRISDEITLLAQSIGSKILQGGALFERTRIGLAYRSDGREGMNALARYEHRTDDDPLAPEGPRDHTAHILSTHANLRPAERLTVRGQWAAKFASDQVAGQQIDQSAQLISGRGTWDLDRRFDVGVIGRTHFGEGRSQYGLGAEMGIRIGSDLRLGAGYNWFGFTDEDLSLDEYTDKGFFIDLGWRFDESLFGWGDDDRRVGAPRNR